MSAQLLDRSAPPGDPGWIVPRSPRAFGWRDAGPLVGALLSSASLAWVVWSIVLARSGTAGFLAVWTCAFFIIYWIVVRETETRLAAKDKLATVLVTVLALSFLVPLTSVLLFVFFEGIKALRVTFFFQTMETTGPLSPATDGGGLHAIIGTFEQVFLAVVLSVPMGILTAVYLQEVGGRFAGAVRMFVQAMSGVPSIIAGLFIYASWILGAGFGFSGFAAAMALAILMVPTVTRTVEEVLRLVPGGLRESALALGATEFKSTWMVVLPTARVGVVTAVILGMARVIGETAPLLMTSFGNSGQANLNPFQGEQESLPYFVWRAYRLQGENVPRAYTGALVLMLFVLVLFVLTRVIGKGRMARRAERASKAQPIRINPGAVDG